jgi:hypothetical protein
MKIKNKKDADAFLNIFFEGMVIFFIFAMMVGLAITIIYFK